LLLPPCKSPKSEEPLIATKVNQRFPIRDVTRYAIYCTPPEGSTWWRFGASWLGRDAASGAVVPQPEVPGVPPEAFRALTETPRRYGFHATIKAPFALRPGATRDGLAAALERFCAPRAAFPMPRFEVARIDDFLALAPAARESRINDLAADCVRDFEPFRAPLEPAELERRRRSRLSPRQDRYLEEFGYPFVLAEYRFHLTLTGSIDRAPPQHAAAVRVAAERATAALADEPLHFDALALFEQPERAGPFRMVARFPFGDRRG
jgi:putative phosphonate metabolism protein